MNIYLKNKEADSMIVNFEGLVSNIYKNVTVNDVLKEAIMNSIHANATSIDIKLQYQYEKSLVDKGVLGQLVKITIKDNGEGFTEENVNSFLEIYTKHKINIGGKGIGRISYLRLANTVKVTSVSKEKKKVTFDFNTELNKDKISYISTNEDLFTSIELSNLNLKTSTTYAQACLGTIQEHFNLLLFLRLKDLNQAITINLFVNDDLFGSVCSNDINCIEESIYTSNNVNFNIYTFKKENETGIKLFYCANYIQVEKTELADKFYKQYAFAITSEFFDKYANEERTVLTLPKDETLNQKELLSDLPDKNYKEELRKACLEIVLKNEPDTKQRNQEKINNIKENYGYINLEGIDIGDLNLNEEDIINKYRDNLNKKEDRLISLLNSKSSIPVEELAKEVSEQNKHELAKYVFHRDIIAKKGNSLTNSKEKEDVLHKLFFPQQSGKTKDVIIDLYNNSIWLLDDKFMSYSYIASDKTISAIASEISTNSFKSQSEPDLFITYNKPENVLEFKDAVLVEFKRGNINYKDKLSAIDQVDEYKSKLEQLKLKISNFYCYIVCDFDGNDKDLERGMTNRGFIKVYSNYGCIYYGYLLGSKTHVTFISSSSVFADAIARNKTFLDILNP